MTNDRQLRRPTTAKKSRALILPKNLEFWKDCLFLKNGENLIFFHRYVPVTKEGNDGWPTTDNSEKNLVHSFCLKILNFGKIACFWKTAKIWFFHRSVPVTKEGNDGRRRRRRRPTTPKKSRTLILTKNHEFWKDCFFFEKQWEFDFFHRSLPVTKEGNDGRPTTATTDDAEKISYTHFA